MKDQGNFIISLISYTIFVLTFVESKIFGHNIFRPRFSQIYNLSYVRQGFPDEGTNGVSIRLCGK